CNAILRAFSRAALRDARRRQLMTVPYDPEFEEDDFPQTKRTDEVKLFTERLDHILRENQADLTGVERMVLEKRFPREEEAERLTLDMIGRQMRVSKERVRQIQLSALSKLRKAIETDAVLK